MSGDSGLPDAPFLYAPSRRLSSAQLVAVDVALVIVAAVAGRYSPPVQSLKYSGTPVHVAAYAAWVLVSIVFLFRRHYPRATLTVLAALLFFGQCVRSPALASDYLAFALYSVVTTSGRRTGALLCAGTVVLCVAGTVIGGGVFVLEYSVGATITILVGWLAAEYVRNARRYGEVYAALVADRAAAAEARRTEQISRAVADERVKLARELHDVVAHGLSVITVRAGVARMVIDTRPDQANEALGIIEKTTRRTLQEMRLLVGVLRGDTAARADLEPAPGLKDLTRVVTDVELAHVAVELAVTGAARPLPAAVDLSAYRIVQEALTNVVRHAGPTTAHVTLDYHPNELRIEVRDDGPAAAHQPAPALTAGGTGHGLIGIRERAALFGGTFTAGRHGPGFRVCVSLHTADVDDQTRGDDGLVPTREQAGPTP